MSRADVVPYATLLLRLALGVLFIAHGLVKLFIYKPTGTAAYFQSLGLPGFVGYLTMAAELGRGAPLLLGIGTTIAALALVPLLLGTIVLVHGSKGWMFNSERGGWEYPAFWSVALVVQAMLGSGAYSFGQVLGVGYL